MAAIGRECRLFRLILADLDRAVQAANFGAFMHQGQICMSIERVIVLEPSGVASRALAARKRSLARALEELRERVDRRCE